MDITTLTVGAVFAVGLALSLPLGYLARIRLTNNRYTHIDGMRAIAAMMVVCSHYISHAALVLGEPTSSPLQVAFGAVGVQIFFSITGFLFTRKAMAGPIDISALIGSRVRRIIPLFVVAMTAAILMAAYISTSLKDAPRIHWYEVAAAYAYGFYGDHAPAIAGISISGQIGQIWTLHWEWWFYLFVPFIAVVLTRGTWLLAALAFAGTCALYQLQVEGQSWVFFLPGVLCALVADRVKLGNVAQAAAFVVGMVAFYLSLTIGAGPYRMTQLLLCLVGFPCLLFGNRWLLSLRPLRYLGEVSYSIYMLHLLVASGFLVIITKDFREVFEVTDDKLWLGLVMTAGLYVLCFVTYALVERPFMRQKTARPGTQPGAVAPSSVSIERAQ
ncbi:acyltransferase family protein [Cupriavidus metallidurans]|uniref:acyltransferase family protein n=1 Tax=Cupriavidus metallidurans TaxID=119219 RepID=UPI001CCE0139|nr:acyltransferase [Cupriavidus metallidurans]UBM11743.1 acyltransferase [Cupriavidus metallidurans]